MHQQKEEKFRDTVPDFKTETKIWIVIGLALLAALRLGVIQLAF